ncbi:MAG TPA: WG repeat-containing protein, partial [Chitinophagaceae bacterium]|nr:WG repeat-containing protein [Chitinophagaceae bacterium]
IGLIGLDGKVWQGKYFSDIECDGNVALLYEGKKRILIDDHFKMIFNPMVYDSIVISRFADTSLFIVGKKSGTDYRWGVIRKNGKEVVPPLYEEIRIDEHPLYKFLVKKNGKAGILDPNGKILLPCMYDYTEGYNDNYHKVGVGFQGHYISLEKDLQVPRIQGYIRERPYACGVYVCFNEKGKLNLLNALNEPVLKEAADYIEPVGELDLFIVKQQNRFGLINGRGKFIIPLEWDTLEYHYGLQLFLGNKNGGMQIFTKEGQPIHHPPFEEIESALGNGELMKFRYHQKEGLMKNSGETVLEARYELVYAQSTNVFLVKEDGQYYYMDSDKNVLTEKSTTYYSKYGSFFLSMAKPCMLLYDSAFHKIENGCGKSLTSTSCNHYYLLNTDSGRICISASGKPLHTGYFDDVVEYGCENSVRIASKKQKYFLLDDHFQKISHEY